MKKIFNLSYLLAALLFGAMIVLPAAQIYAALPNFDTRGELTSLSSRLELGSEEPSSSAQEALRLDVVGEDGDQLRVQYRTALPGAAGFRIGLRALDPDEATTGNLYGLAYLTPTGTGDYFDHTVSATTFYGGYPVPDGDYYFSITRADELSQTNVSNYGNGANTFRNLMLRVQDSKFSILEMTDVVTNNKKFHDADTLAGFRASSEAERVSASPYLAYANPADFLDPSLSDSSYPLKDPHDEEVFSLSEAEQAYIKTKTDALLEGITSDYEKARTIYRFVADSFYYDNYANDNLHRQIGYTNPYHNLQKIEGVWTGATGNFFPEPGKVPTTCSGYSALMMAMLRSQGIPTRMVFGYHLSVPAKTWDGAHASNYLDNDNHYWTEFYSGGRWITADANMGSSSTWSRTSENDAGIWNETGFNNYIYFDPSEEVLATSHYIQGVYSRHIIAGQEVSALGETAHNDAQRLRNILAFEVGTSTPNKAAMGLEASIVPGYISSYLDNHTTESFSYVDSNRIFSWDLNKFYANPVTGGLQQFNFSLAQDTTPEQREQNSLVGPISLNGARDLSWVNLSRNPKVTGLSVLNGEHKTILKSVFAITTGLTRLELGDSDELTTVHATYSPLKFASYSFGNANTVNIDATDQAGNFGIKSLIEGRTADNPGQISHEFSAKSDASHAYFKHWEKAPSAESSYVKDLETETYAIQKYSAAAASGKKLHLRPVFNVLAAPTGLSITNVGATTQILKWKSVSGADGYKLYRKDPSKDWVLMATVKKEKLGTSPQYEKKWLDSGSKYQYKIVSYMRAAGTDLDPRVRSLDSAVVSRATWLASPKSVKVVNGSTTRGQILSWGSVKNADGYLLYRNENGGLKDTSGKVPWILMKQITSGTTSSFAKSGLISGKNYGYKVVAYRNANPAVNGNTARLYSSSSVIVSLPTKIARPTNVKVVNGSNGTSQILSWSQVAGASGYKLYRKDPGKTSYVLMRQITSGATTSYTKSYLTTGSTYSYKVVAYKNVYKWGSSLTRIQALSADSSVVSRKLIPATPSITSISAGYKTASLKWAPISGASGYTIYRSDSSGGTYKAVKTLTGSRTASFTHRYLTSGKRYYFKIRAFKTVGSLKIYSNYSAYKSAVIK